MNTTRRNSWMWAEACALLEEAERKHRHFFDLSRPPAGRSGSRRPTFSRTESELHVVVALPGARVDEVAVQITPTGLQIDTTVPPPAVSARHERRAIGNSLWPHASAH